ncbi:MAG: WalW protein [Gammaproteobacteria bacterium]
MRKINFLLSIDTEEEWDWEGPFPEKIISMENIKMIPDFQYFLNKLGVRPSYFIDYAVADDPVACQILQDVFRDNPQAEVCAHLHPWVNPPVVPVTTEAMSHIVNLPIETVEQQLIQLTNKLECCFQYRPVSFRSGRWGINGNILRVLARLGYRVDSSVCPYYETEHFSCSKNSSAVYWPDYTFVDKPGTQRDILEIPVGAGFNRVNFQWVNRLHVQLQKKKKMIADGYYVIHMYFHSSSLLPGGSNYVASEAQKKEFLEKIRTVVNFLKTQGDVSFLTVGELGEKYRVDAPKTNVL